MKAFPLHLAFYGALIIIGALTLRLRRAAGAVLPREDGEIADLKRGAAAQREPPERHDDGMDE